MDRNPIAWRPTVVVLLATAAGAVLSLGTLVLTGDGRERDGMDAAGMTAATVLEDPDRFVGKSVRLRDWETEVVTARSVTLGPGRLLVLNIAVAPAIDDMADDDRRLVGDAVEVTGEVRLFRMDDIEAEVGVLDEELFQAFSGQPVMIARSIEPVNARAAPRRHDGRVVAAEARRSATGDRATSITRCAAGPPDATCRALGLRSGEPSRE